MHVPNYNGSIVNLISTIVRHFGGKNKYPMLRMPKIKTKKVLFLIVDGLGYEYLKEYGENTVFNDHIKKRLTSVFPSTTAACISSFGTGVGPMQHGVTGWFTYFKELGAVCLPLLFRTRFGGMNFSGKVDPKIIMDCPGIDKTLKDEFLNVLPVDVAESSFTGLLTDSKILKFTTLNGMFRQINKALKGKKKKLVHAYWPGFDMVSHRYGVHSYETFLHMVEINNSLVNLIQKLKDTTIIVTADHGLIDTPNVIYVDDHPELRDSLSVPLCGEPRAAFCYVHANRKKKFEQYVRKNLSKYCYLYKSEKLVEKGFFGKGKSNKKFLDRIGDYTLIMKKDYIIVDSLEGEGSYVMPANHGGVSSEEMYVPLVFIET